jgi:hypothetical protein
MEKFEDEEAFIKSDKSRLCFLSTLIFALLLYSLPLAKLIQSVLVIFPFVGKELSYVIVSLGLWGIIYLLLWFIQRFYVIFFPSFPQVIAALNRRTGVPHVDVIGFWLSLTSAIFFLFTSLLLFPIALTSAFAFGILMFQRVELWPVKERTRHIPPDLIPKPQPMPDETGYDHKTKSLVSVANIKEYRWKFERRLGETCEGFMRLAISLARYQEYKDKNPFLKWPSIPPHEEIIHELTVNGVTDEVIQAVVHFTNMNKDKNFSVYEELMNVLAFVQSMTYDISKEEGKDYWRYPIETLEETKGDCDCLSILAAAIFTSIFHKTVVLLSEKHAAVAVAGAEGFPGNFFEFEGERYYYCETTAEGWRVGEMPQGANIQHFKAYRVQ